MLPLQAEIWLTNQLTKFVRTRKQRLKNHKTWYRGTKRAAYSKKGINRRLLPN